MLVNAAAGRNNLRALFDQATPDDVAAGGCAYDKYNTVMQRFADFYGFGLVPVTEAFVALSPNNDYHGNLRSLAAVLTAARFDIKEPTVS